MANKDDVSQANEGAPAADIPDLKKKEKERKKAGAGWGSAKPGGGSFSGATGGTVARSAASVMGGGAAAGAAGAVGGASGGFFAWVSSVLGGLTATLFGKMLLAAGAAAFLAGAALFGYAMLKGGGAGGGGVGLADLGALSSDLKIRGGGGDRTGYVASKGELAFDPVKAAVAKKAPEKAPEEKPAEAPAPPAQTADAAGKGADWNRPGLAHNMSGSKLTSSLGGGSSIFGGKSIFNGNSAAPKLNTGLSSIKIAGGQKGKLTASRNARTGRVVKGAGGRQMKANKAFGQLKIAKGMSTSGAGSAITEGASASAAAAFDGQNGIGNVQGGPNAAGTGIGMPDGATASVPNGSAPDFTAPDVDDPDGTDLVDHSNISAINGIASMAKQAGAMKAQAEQMMMLGLLLIAIGIAVMAIFPPVTAPLGAALIGLGGMFIGMSMMMSQMAAMMKSMADAMSDALAARTSDINKNATNRYCVERAYEGVDPQNCNPPDTVTEAQRFNTEDSQAVQEHRDMVNETGRVEGLNGNPTPP